MKMALSAQALRVIGCLLEKQVTTPDQYPLSLNGVVTACNQKSNREPVMNLSESEVQAQLDELVKSIWSPLTAVSVNASANMNSVSATRRLAICS